MKEYKFTGRIQDIIPSLFNLDVNAVYDISIQIHKDKKKRILNENNYAWALISELAKVLKMPKENVYLQMLYDYGISTTLTLKKGNDLRGFDKCYSKIVESTDLYDVVAICVGSSNYSTEEMNNFIQGIRAECEQVGINPDLSLEQWLKT